MPEHMRAQLLSFSTGSSQVPSGGFRFLQPELFTIQRVGVTDRFPAAHTCANTLDLPEYTSKEVLEQHLRFAWRRPETPLDCVDCVGCIALGLPWWTCCANLEFRAQEKCGSVQAVRTCKGREDGKKHAELH